MNSKILAQIFGAVFVLIAILGFVGGVGIVGEDGLFATDAVHDFIHLGSGVILLLVAAMAPMRAALTMMILGVVYALVAFLGLFSETHVAGILMNDADDFLHIALALGLFMSGYLNRD